MSPEEARLLALERRVMRIPVLDLERRVVAAEQGLAQSWTWGVGYQTPPGPPPLDPAKIYIGVRCWAEGGAPFNGCPITITDGFGATMDSGFSAADGTWVSIGLSPGFYYANTSATGLTNFSGGQTYSATGVVTWLDALIYLTSTTLTAADSRYGNATLAWSGSQWTGSLAAATAACGTCPAWTSVPVHYTLSDTSGGTVAVQYLGVSTTGCPTDARTVGARLFIVPGLTRGPQVYSGGLSLEFDLAPGGSGNPLYCLGGTTITITQP